MVASLRKSSSERELKPGQVFSAEVRDLASDGRGVVSHPNGRTFFVAGVWPGERGEFRITGLKGRIGFATVAQLSEEHLHPARVSPLCAHHGISQRECGGCPWQFMDYHEQLGAKQKRIETSLTRLGVQQHLQPIVASPAIYGYRNRAQLKTDGAQLGYLAAASHQLVAVQQCPVLSEHNQQTLAGLLQQLPNATWKPRGRERWSTLDIDESVSAQNPAVNQRLPFQQANSQQNQWMCDWLAKHLQITAKGKTIVELFCGSGNLTQVLARLGAQNILAVEVVSDALQRLDELVLPGVETLHCDLFDEGAARSFSKRLRDADILVLDPPRDGLVTRETLWPKTTRLQTIVSISCDLATFSRDLAFFMAQGFEVERVQPLDQFPHTPHIELLASLTRR